MKETRCNEFLTGLQLRTLSLTNHKVYLFFPFYVTQKLGLKFLTEMLDISISWQMVKVSSVQEACAKCFAVLKSKFEILQTTWKNKTKSIKMLDLLVKNWKLRVWCSLFHFLHVICKILNFNMWTAEHLAQASCSELTFKWVKPYS